MIKIITAIGNPNLNNELKKYEEFKVIGNDILYSEGIIELLEKDADINYLIIGENCNNNLENIIFKIKEINNKLKIILIINKNNNLEKNFYFKLGISEMFYEDENIENIINYLKTKNIEYLNIELRSEIDNLKRIILENKKENKFNKKIKKNICIGFVGPAGIGKTTSCILFAKALNKNNKLLIIDFNLINSQIGIIYDKKIDYSKINEKNINELIFNVEKNIDILIGLDILNEYKKIDFFNLNKKINELKNKYDYIFVDTFFYQIFENNKYIFDCFDYIFLHSGINDLEVFKSNKIINIIINKLKINIEKIRIIYYKINLFEIIKLIIYKNNFLEIKKIGIIKNNIFFRKDVKKENKIINKLLIKKIIKNI